MRRPVVLSQMCEIDHGPKGAAFATRCAEGSAGAPRRLGGRGCGGCGGGGGGLDASACGNTILPPCVSACKLEHQQSNLQSNSMEMVDVYNVHKQNHDVGHLMCLHTESTCSSQSKKKPCSGHLHCESDVLPTAICEFQSCSCLCPTQCPRCMKYACGT